jgi:2-octaprenyl-6-methoxyphenol hydroxylase
MSAAPPSPALRLAVIGAGPAGLALSLQALQSLPALQLTLFDARPLDRDPAGDPRVLALALGGIQQLQRLQAWPAALAEPILAVHVSQATPAPALGPLLPGAPAVQITAAEQGVDQLGAVLTYGTLVAALQARMVAAAQAEAGRVHLCFGQPVAGLKAVAGGVEVDAGSAETFDLAVVAEGGVFADQARKAIRHDYRQTAWVGTAEVEGLQAGTAFERFTRQGPLALLPLPSPAGSATVRRASIVWCVDTGDDPVAGLDAGQRIAVLNTLLPPAAGRIVALSALKSFALGLNAERSLVDGRIVRIGNAAQTLHPVAGQGLNLGLRDAHSLVQALRGVADGGARLDAGLRSVEWQRAPDRYGMIAATDFLARSFTWQFPGVGSARGLALAALQAAPPLKALLAQQMMFGRR